MISRPLSRSLDPLPEESVTGYLLRLSYRLRVSPLHLARLTGCVVPGEPVIGRRTLFGSDVPQLARAARLTESEAESLTAGSWAGRYPPVGRSVIKPGHRLQPDGWLTSTRIRYCPQCLAGDGTPLLQQYGGPWKKTWHLPVVFACTRHRRFLAEGCPREHRRTNSNTVFIPSPAASGIHPLQCRMPEDGKTGPGRQYCGMRLDQVGDGGLPPPTPGILAVQERILALLRPEHPAPEAARTFTDLRLLSALVCLTWPLSENLMPPSLADAVTGHVRSSKGNNRSYDRPARGILATAGILTAAASIRDAPDLERLLDRYIRPGTWPSSAKEAWAHILRRHHAACSQELRKPALDITSRRIASNARTGRRSRWPAILATASETGL